MLMLTTALLLSTVGLLSALPAVTEAKGCDKPCMNGQCNAATGNCVCFPGWVGDQCQHCGGRFRYGQASRCTGEPAPVQPVLQPGLCAKWGTAPVLTAGDAQPQA